MQMLIALALRAAFAGPEVVEVRPGIVCNCIGIMQHFSLPAISLAPIPLEPPGPGAAEGAGQAGTCAATAGIERPPLPPREVEGRPLLWSSVLARDPLMCATIGADGRVRAVSIIRGTGDPALDAEAMGALAAIRFTPAFGSGGPRESRHVVTGHLARHGYHYLAGE
jgi:TonB family protein